MARPCEECNDPSVTGCQCGMQDTPTIAWEGSGSVDHPFEATAQVSAEARNRLDAVSDGLRVRTYPWCKIGLSTNSDRTNGQNLLWDTELSDLWNMFDASSDNREIAIKENGWYVCHAKVFVDMADGQTAWATIEDQDLHIVSTKSFYKGPGGPVPSIDVYEEQYFTAGMAVQVVLNFTPERSPLTVISYPWNAHETSTSFLVRKVAET